MGPESNQLQSSKIRSAAGSRTTKRQQNAGLALGLATLLAANGLFIASSAASEKHLDGATTASKKTATTIRLRASGSSTEGKLQWRPTRNGESVQSQPVRTVRYEEDVFADGPALGRSQSATQASAPVRLSQAPPSAPLRNPFDEAEEPTTPTTPMPTEPTPMEEPSTSPLTPPFDIPATEPTRPLPTEPMPTEPTPTTPFPAEPTPDPSRPEFRTPFMRDEDPTITPRPGETPRTAPNPLGQPETDPLSPPNRFEPTQPRPFSDFRVPDSRPMREPADDCEAAYQKLRTNTIDKLDIDIRIAGEPGNQIPFECTLSDDPFDPRQWRSTTYTWKASALCHKPIYFQDVALERYGHSHGPVCEYFASAAHFFGDVILLPYNMGVKTPNECVYTLGYYRPGNCAPYMLDPFPFSLRGAAFGALGYGATIAIFP